MRLALALLFLLPALALAAPVDASAPDRPSTIRVNVASQSYDFFRPWSKKAPVTKRGLGVLIARDRVLISAELVADATYIELEKGESGAKSAATVEVIDYEANLALLKPGDPQFLKDYEPLQLGEATVGDRVSVLQLEPTGVLLITNGVITTIEVSGYPVGESSLLVYRMTSSLQYREGSFVLPVVKGDKLVGLLMRYDPRSQNADILPTPVIRHFLKAAEDSRYTGFPEAGVAFAAMRDPQLRRYAGLDGEGSGGGVYLTKVERDGPAEKAGLKVGDVLLGVDDVNVDQDGNYLDPVYGKISIAHLITTKHFAGDVVKAHILRDGKRKTVDVTLRDTPASQKMVASYVIDQPPGFYILGGLVLQELSLQYLKEWGGDWEKQAPQRLVYFGRFYEEVFGEDRGKLVLLSQVLPSPDTIGYEGLGYLIVTSINDRPIKGLADVAEAVRHPVDGFHKIEFSDDPKVIYLDAAAVKANEATLKANYGLPFLHRGVPEPAEK